jgi:hypothetical protein
MMNNNKDNAADTIDPSQPSLPTGQGYQPDLIDPRSIGLMQLPRKVGGWCLGARGWKLQALTGAIPTCK